MQQGLLLIRCELSCSFKAERIGDNENTLLLGDICFSYESRNVHELVLSWLQLVDDSSNDESTLIILSSGVFEPDRDRDRDSIQVEQLGGVRLLVIFGVDLVGTFLEGFSSLANTRP